MLDLAEIRARLPQPTPAMPRSSYTLAAEWDVTRQTFGRSRHMLSDAVNGDDVYLMIEVRPGSRVEWHCSPPGYDERDYASGTVLVEQDAVNPALDEAKQQAFAAWARWVSEDTGEPVPPELNPEEQDIADLLSEVDRLAPDAQQWVKLRGAIYVASKRMGYELPRGDHDLVILMANALHFAVTAHRTNVVDGSPSTWVFSNLTWMPNQTDGIDLVADVFGGITVATIATKAQLMPDSAPLRWTADGRPPQAGDAWSFTEALKAIRRALPSCPVPDLPAGVK